MSYNFNFDTYSKRISTIFNDKRGNILSKALQKTPKSALCANILMGTSQLGTNGQAGFNQIKSQCLNFPLDHYLHCNVGLEWYFITGSLEENKNVVGTFLIVFLYHQLLPQKYCPLVTPPPLSLYSIGEGRILETIVSICYSGKRYYKSSLNVLEGADIIMNMKGPFWLPGTQPIAKFSSLDNSLNEISISCKFDDITFNAILTDTKQGPITGAYSGPMNPYKDYTWGPMAVCASLTTTPKLPATNKPLCKLTGVALMDHQWGTLSKTNIWMQLLNLLGVIKVSPLNLGWGLNTKELALGCIINMKQNTCIKPCYLMMEGVALVLNKSFPLDIQLKGVLPNSEHLKVTYTLTVDKWIKLDSTKYPLYLTAKIHPKTLLPLAATGYIGPASFVPPYFKISPIYDKQRIFWESGGEAYEGGTILTDKDGNHIGTGFLECTGWLDWRTFTSQVLKNIDISQTTDNITLFSTRSLAQPITLLVFVLLFLIIILVTLFWSIIFHVKKKVIYYPFKSLVISMIMSGFIVLVILVGGGAFAFAPAKSPGDPNDVAKISPTPTCKIPPNGGKINNYLYMPLMKLYAVQRVYMMTIAKDDTIVGILVEIINTSHNKDGVNICGDWRAVIFNISYYDNTLTPPQYTQSQVIIPNNFSAHWNSSFSVIQNKWNAKWTVDKTTNLATFTLKNNSDINITVTNIMLFAQGTIVNNNKYGPGYVPTKTSVGYSFSCMNAQCSGTVKNKTISKALTYVEGVYTPTSVSGKTLPNFVCIYILNSDYNLFICGSTGKSTATDVKGGMITNSSKNYKQWLSPQDFDIKHTGSQYYSKNAKANFYLSYDITINNWPRTHTTLNFSIKPAFKHQDGGMQFADTGVQYTQVLTSTYFKSAKIILEINKFSNSPSPATQINNFMNKCHNCGN